MTGREIILLSFNKGYRADGGKIYSPSGKKRKLIKDRDGYLWFSISTPIGTRRVAVHRLTTYQKFGEASMQPGIETRHLNSNPADNREENLEIGTKQQNKMDQSPRKRRRLAQNAANHLRTLTDGRVARIREEHKAGKSYKALSKKWGVCKSQLSFILSKTAKKQSRY